MNVLVGVDLGGRYEAALGLLQRLGFPGLRARLVHCVEPIMPDGGFPDPASTGQFAQIVAELERLGRKHLDEVAEAVQPWVPDVETKLMLGRAVASLSGEAKSWPADLVAVGSERKGSWGSMFLGSVSKGITIGSEVSVLVGKQPVSHDGPLRAVFATDLSPTAESALLRFAGFRSAGLGEARLVHCTPDGAEGTGEELAGLAGRLSGQLGVEVAPAVVHGKPDDCLREAMEGADLLVLGARGHGFVGSWVLGSVAAHQVVRESYNVAVVRP